MIREQIPDYEPVPPEEIKGSVRAKLAAERTVGRSLTLKPLARVARRKSLRARKK
jgi:hypothetical protein